MQWREQHEAFKKLAIQQGISNMEHLRMALPFGYQVPQARMERWLRDILSLPKGFSTQRRYVNRFKLGADPEFIFTKNGCRADARNSAFGLHQGLAYGMDNNGRLVEIRPYPSRSALHVVASILSTLRWLSVLSPITMTCDWECGAFLQGDGIGGHVHFGRKRPNRSVEVKALDVIEEELLALKAYPLAEVLRRRQGDGRNPPYGLPGDIRKQMHGYEYRTFPSWLDSPKLAFLTITLSKLAVLNPSLCQGYAPLIKERYPQRIWNLLAYYKDVDDDARLALYIVAKGFPRHLGGDFRKRWGLEASTLPAPEVLFVPSSIKPDAHDVRELFDHLKSDAPLSFRIPDPTWGPIKPPAGYAMVIKECSTWGAKGLGEMIWDVVKHKSLPYTITNSRDMHDKYFFSVPMSLANMLPTHWERLCNYKVTTHMGADKLIYSNEHKRDVANFAESRRLLLETVFPFWKISELKGDSVLQWRSTLQKSNKQLWASKFLHGDIADLPIKF